MIETKIWKVLAQPKALPSAGILSEGGLMAVAGPLGIAAAAALGAFYIGGAIADWIAPYCPCSHPVREEHAGIPLCYKGTCEQEFGTGYVTSGWGCGIGCKDTWGDCYYDNGTWCANKGSFSCWSSAPSHSLNYHVRSAVPVLINDPKCSATTK